MKKTYALIAIMLALVFLTGCTANMAVQYAAAALKSYDVGINDGYHCKYSDKSKLLGLQEIPDELDWDTVPDAGYCFIFDLESYYPFTIAAYVTLEGEVVCTLSDVDYQAAIQSVEYYNKPETLEKYKQKGQREQEKYTSDLKSALDKAEENGDVALFLAEQSARCRDDRRDNPFKPFSEQEKETITRLMFHPNGFEAQLNVQGMTALTARLNAAADWVDRNLGRRWADVLDRLPDMRGRGHVSDLLMAMGPFALLSALCTLLAIIHGARCKKHPRSAKPAIRWGRLALLFALLWLVVWAVPGILWPVVRTSWCSRLSDIDPRNAIVLAPVAIVALIHLIVRGRARKALKAEKARAAQQAEQAAARAEPAVMNEAASALIPSATTDRNAIQTREGESSQAERAVPAERSHRYEFRNWSVNDTEIIYLKHSISLEDVTDVESGKVLGVPEIKIYLGKKKYSLTYSNKKEGEKGEEALAFIKSQLAMIKAQRREVVLQKLTPHGFHIESELSYAPRQLTMFLDNASRQMAFAWEDKSCRVTVFPYGHIVNCEILQSAHKDTTHTRVGSSVGGTYVGSGFSSSTSYLDSLGIKFTLRDPANPLLTIPLITSKCFAESLEAQNALSFANRVKAAATAAMAMGQPEGATAASDSGDAARTPEEPSTVEQLKQFKGLLDAGILTQEEFDAKKKQLLGL